MSINGIAKERIIDWSRTKNGKPHAIPVPSVAAELIESIKPNEHGWLFPSAMDPTKPVKAGTLYSFMWRQREREVILPDEDDEQPNKHGDTAPDDDEIDKRNKLLIDIWKQAVDTQKHFNDMCVKSRQLGLTFVAASLGAALYLFIRSTPLASEAETAVSRSISAYSFSICGHPIVLHVSLAIIIAAAAAVYAVKRLDLGVYHQMLRGAVTFGEDLEEKHIRHIVGLQKGIPHSDIEHLFGKLVPTFLRA